MDVCPYFGRCNGGPCYFLPTDSAPDEISVCQEGEVYPLYPAGGVHPLLAAILEPAPTPLSRVFSSPPLLTVVRGRARRRRTSPAP